MRKSNLFHLEHCSLSTSSPTSMMIWCPILRDWWLWTSPLWGKRGSQHKSYFISHTISGLAMSNAWFSGTIIINYRTITDVSKVYCDCSLICGFLRVRTVVLRHMLHLKNITRYVAQNFFFYISFIIALRWTSLQRLRRGEGRDSSKWKLLTFLMLKVIWIYRYRTTMNHILNLKQNILRPLWTSCMELQLGR